MFSSEFLLASLVVVLLPGTGVLYTMSIGFSRGWQASLVAAFGCTLGIVPHLLASIFGLSVIFRTSPFVFIGIKIVGIIYLFYLAWDMWKDSGSVDTTLSSAQNNSIRIIAKAILLNVLNPKLTLFFFAFLPMFTSEISTNPTFELLELGLVFMILTLLVFSLYGVFAGKVRQFFNNSSQIATGFKRSFSMVFIILGVKLALLEN